MIRLYGPASAHRRGGTVAFNVLDPTGRVVDERAVSRDASLHRISLRTGCFCNPGAAEAAFRLPRRALRSAPLDGTFEGYRARRGLPGGGAIRISLGLVSTLEDVERFLRFVADTYRDRLPHLAGLSRGNTCEPI